MNVSRCRPLSRRQALLLGSGALVAATQTSLMLTTFARAGTPEEDIMNPGPLPDKFLGSPEAPITIIEYASMTCPHCAQFAITTFPEIKARYIETGKVRYTIRLLPFDEFAAAATMLALSSGDRYFDVVDLLLHLQRQWTTDRIQELMSLAIKQLGFTPQSFKACLSDRQLWENIRGASKRANDLQVTHAPTFFINGKKHTGYLSIAEIEGLIVPYLEAQLPSGLRTRSE
jgi:protein-disulfide isomerase